MRRIQLGPTGRTVAANIARLRKSQGMTLRDMADRLADVGRPLQYTAVADVEKGGRRVDTDDLTAIAVVLGVSPMTLLMGETPSGAGGSAKEVEMTGVGTRVARDVFDWLRADLPLDPDADPREFRARSVPLWAETLADLGMDGRGRAKRMKGHRRGDS